MSYVTPGRIVVVRLAHGWRHAGVVITGCADWQERHPITVHVFDRGPADLEALFPGLNHVKRCDVATGVLNTGARVHRSQGFVIVGLPEVGTAPNDEHDVGWFFPPRQ